MQNVIEVANTVHYQGVAIETATHLVLLYVNTNVQNHRALSSTMSCTAQT